MQVILRAMEIVDKSLPILKKYKLLHLSPLLDFVDIFPKSVEECTKLTSELRVLGSPVFSTETGATYKLHVALPTASGDFSLVRVRKFDPTKLEFLGHPDYVFKNYAMVKELLLRDPHVNVVTRPEYEMLEIWDKDFEVCLYVPSVPLSNDIKFGQTTD